jgi:hypothetical protein
MTVAGQAVDDEIIVAITRALKPWAPQMRQIESGEQEADPQPEAAISGAVRAEVLRFCTMAVPDFFHRNAIKQTRDDARAVIKAIDSLTDLLSALTISPELRVRLGQHDRLIGSPSDLANMPVPRLVEALLEVRGICQSADENQPQADQVKKWCAMIAIRLILRFSTTKPNAGSDQSAYCTIAGLLYERDGKGRAVARGLPERPQALPAAAAPPAEFIGQISSELWKPR